MMTYLFSSVFETQVAEFMAMVTVVFMFAFVMFNTILYFTKLVRIIIDNVDYISKKEFKE